MAQERITIAVLAGTAREKRQSIKAARYVAAFGRQLDDVEIIFVDPEDFHFPGDGNDPEGKDVRYTEITERADAFFIVTPEYNHGYPGTLKRMLDSELENYLHKPVALAGASSHHWGGTRVVEALTMTVREMGLVVSSFSVYFPNVGELFDENDELKPEHKEMYQKNLHDAYAELLWLARTLKWGRENIAKD